MEQQLTSLYPKLEIHYCRRDTINSELDVYIPSLRLAFEYNGIFHYEPIHGEERLAGIINNDKRKYQACLEHGIELCIIDTTRMRYCVPSRMGWVLDIVKDLINKKMVGPENFEISTPPPQTECSAFELRTDTFALKR